MLLSKRCAIVSKAYSISKELGDKAAAYLAGSTITKKKFRNIVPTLSRTG
jgi:hypothetical protein